MKRQALYSSYCLFIKLKKSYSFLVLQIQPAKTEQKIKHSKMGFRVFISLPNGPQFRSLLPINATNATCIASLKTSLQLRIIRLFKAQQSHFKADLFYSQSGTADHKFFSTDTLIHDVRQSHATRLTVVRCRQYALSYHGTGQLQSE